MTYDAATIRCHTNMWPVPAAFRTRAAAAAKRRPLVSPADDHRAKLSWPLHRIILSEGRAGTDEAAQKGAKRVIYDFFGLLITE